MKRRTKADIAPSGYEIRIGMSSPYIVVQASAANDFDPVAAFDSLQSAMEHFPSARVTDGALRKAKEKGEKSRGASSDAPHSVTEDQEE